MDKELEKLKTFWEENLKTSVRLKAPQGEQEMILWFLKTIDDSIKNQNQK